MRLDDVKKLSPVERFKYWVLERESIRLKRKSGSPAPWTDDPILQTYRFCNVRRMDDKVSQWLLTNWYKPFHGHRNMLAAVALARFINKPESLGPITDHVFPPSGTKSPFWESIKRTLGRLKKNGPVFNGAYMVRGNSPNTKDKIKIVVDEYVRPMVETVAWFRFNADSMEETHRLISSQYGFGSFMAGQVVADLRWAVPGEWTDKNHWAPVGPGSARGLARTLYGDEWKTTAKGYTSKDAEGFLQDLSALRKKVERSLSKDIYSRLEMHDWQNVCCEVDKYTRVLQGEGKPKQLYRGGK